MVESMSESADGLFSLKSCSSVVSGFRKLGARVADVLGSIYEHL
jgi:hypothetical protein